MKGKISIAYNIGSFYRRIKHTRLEYKISRFLRINYVIFLRKSLFYARFLLEFQLIPASAFSNIMKISQLQRHGSFGAASTHGVARLSGRWRRRISGSQLFGHKCCDCGPLVILQHAHRHITMPKKLRFFPSAFLFLSAFVASLD